MSKTSKTPETDPTMLRYLESVCEEYFHLSADELRATSEAELGEVALTAAEADTDAARFGELLAARDVAAMAMSSDSEPVRDLAQKLHRVCELTVIEFATIAKHDEFQSQVQGLTAKLSTSDVRLLDSMLKFAPYVPELSNEPQAHTN